MQQIQSTPCRLTSRFIDYQYGIFHRASDPSCKTAFFRAGPIQKYLYGKKRGANQPTKAESPDQSCGHCVENSFFKAFSLLFPRLLTFECESLLTCHDVKFRGATACPKSSGLRL